jgi:hypothetical protein
MVGELIEIPAHPGSEFKILTVSAGPDQPSIEPTLAQRVQMAKRVQEFALAAKRAFKWGMGETKKGAAPAPAAAAVSSDGLEADLASLAPGGNIYAAAINSAIAGKAEKQRVVDMVISITPSKPVQIQPGESLLDAARRILKEQAK